MRRFITRRLVFCLATLSLSLGVVTEIVQGDSPSPAPPTSLATRELELTILVNQSDHPVLYATGMNQLDDFTETEAEAGGEHGRWVAVAKDSHGDDKVTGNSYGTLSRVRTRKKGPITEYLVITLPEEERITRDRVVYAEVLLNPSDGAVINLEFDARGKLLLHDLTFRYQPRSGSSHKTHLGILVGDELHAAPTINDIIPGGSCQITGRFTSEEIQDLVSLFDAPAPIVLEPFVPFWDPLLRGVSNILVPYLAITPLVLLLLFFYFHSRAKHSPAPLNTVPEDSALSRRKPIDES
ncbi:MAG: hypothetical protein R3C01_01430 [Planctomycetaceae bacterium]